MVFSTLSLFCHLLTCSGNAAQNAGFVRLRGLGGDVPKTLREVDQVLQKLWGSPEERFQQRFHELRAQVGARLHRQVPIGPVCAIAPRSGPDSVGPSWHRLVLLDAVVGPRQLCCTTQPSGPDRAPISSSGPDCTVGPDRSGPDQGAIALSLLASLYKVTRRHPQQHRR